MTLYDRASGRILPTYFSDGRWYVAGKPGNEYEIRIRNQSGGDVLAVTSVDGVNVVSGETAAPGQTGYVLASGSYLPIKGWRKDMSKVAAFYFTRLDDSYAARTGRPDNVGVIGVAVFRRKVEPPVALEDERYGRDDSAAGSAGSPLRATLPTPRRRPPAERTRRERSVAEEPGYRARPHPDFAGALYELRARVRNARRSDRDLVRQPHEPGGARRHSSAGSGAARSATVPRELRSGPARALSRYSVSTILPKCVPLARCRRPRRPAPAERSNPPPASVRA